MDFQEREALVRRIVGGKLYSRIKYNNQEYDIIFNDPSLATLAESDFIYDIYYNNLKETGSIITLEDSYNILKDQGLWKDSEEELLKKLKENVSSLKKSLPGLKFKKKEQKATQNLIDELQTKLTNLNDKKNQLWPSTIEYMAETRRRRFIISKISVGSFDPQFLLNNQSFIDTLVVYYYKESNLDVGKTRELARTDPWRLYWIVSKDTGTPLFSHSAVEMTELQYSLVQWTRIYDYAYSSSNRPSDDVIENDHLFDGWYEQEKIRIDNESKSNDASNIGVGGSEVFIPSDAEGAKEVYKLNNPVAKSVISQREKAIEKKGEVLELDLPDIKREIQLEMNRLSMQQR